MNDAQTWTLLGGFFTILVAFAGVVLALIRAEVQGLRNEMRARFEGLERDLQRLYEHAFSREVPPAA